jgi:hypothetical protein
MLVCFIRDPVASMCPSIKLVPCTKCMKWTHNREMQCLFCFSVLTAFLFYCQEKQDCLLHISSNTSIQYLKNLFALTYTLVKKCEPSD